MYAAAHDAAYNAIWNFQLLPRVFTLTCANSEPQLISSAKLLTSLQSLLRESLPATFQLTLTIIHSGTYSGTFTVMSTALANVTRLKPEIRLAQAVSQFDADLSSDQKATLRTYRSQIQHVPPDPSDVMRLTAEIDRRATGKMGSRRCFGPRMTNFLYAVQQFAAIGDIMIGGSQNLIACGVWSLVRMSLLVSVSFFTAYVDRKSVV